MGTKGTAAGVSAFGYFEPSLEHRLLPGCPCGSPHPIALRSADPDTCPGCGQPAQPPSVSQSDIAQLVGWRFWVAAGRICLGAGKRLMMLAKKIHSGRDLPR